MTADLDLGDVLGKITPHTRSVPICLDGALEDERTHLEEQLQSAREADDRADAADYQPQAPLIAQRILDIEAAAKDVTVEFTFRSIGRQSWRTIASKHPPTELQLQKARDQDQQAPNVNEETFPKAVMLKSLVSPKGVTEERLDELERTLSAGQWDRLWLCCKVANLGAGDVGESVAAHAVIRRTRPNSAPVSDSESPDPSS